MDGGDARNFRGMCFFHERHCARICRRADLCITYIDAGSQILICINSICLDYRHLSGFEAVDVSAPGLAMLRAISRDFGARIDYDHVGDVKIYLALLALQVPLIDRDDTTTLGVGIAMTLPTKKNTLVRMNSYCILLKFLSAQIDQNNES